MHVCLHICLCIYIALRVYFYSYEYKYISFISKIWKISKHLHAVTVQYHESDNEQLQDEYSNLD